MLRLIYIENLATKLNYFTTFIFYKEPMIINYNSQQTLGTYLKNFKQFQKSY